MKTIPCLVLATGVVADQANPIEKIVQMMGDLQSKIIGEGEECQKVYEEFAEWCEDSSKDLGFEIKTAKAEVADLKATIEKESARSEALDTKISELASDIATDEADLKAATEIREKEHTVFVAEQKELSTVIDMLQRAIAVLEKELGGGASMMQIKSATSLEQALAVMVKASGISSMDANGIMALAQTSSKSEDDDDDSEAGAPEAAAYESHSGGIIDTLNGLLEQATSQLDEATKAETTNKNNFDMLKQGLTDEIKFANKDMDESKKELAESGEIKAKAEGDLEVSSKALAEDIAALADLHGNCMAKAQDFEAETTSRGEELKALAMAKKAVVENTSGATEQSYDFMQMSSSSDLKNTEAVQFIKNLAKKHRAPALAQLASRIASALRLNHGDDVFAKIKGMVTDMIEKLEEEQAAAAELKQWCDKEISEATAKKDDATAELEKLNTKLESDSAHSAKLKEEVATLQKELSELAARTEEMNKIRAEEKALYEKNRPEMEQGLKGVKLALKILNDYYAKADKSHSASSGGASGIVGLLEVVESDFTKGLTEMIAAEEAAVAAYESETKENAIEKTTKEKDVEYKTKEFTALDKTIGDTTKDRDGVQDELDAVNSALEALDKKCTYKVESYEERKARREAEIGGLKEALEIIESETALVQTSVRHALRGVRKH
jgi:chromosome segregation ATPase